MDKLKTKDDLLSGYPLLKLSYSNIEKSNELNFILECNIFGHYLFFDPLGTDDEFNENQLFFFRVLNEIKENNLPAIYRIDEDIKNYEDFYTFLKSRTEENCFDSQMEVFLLKSDSLDNYFENLEIWSKGGLKIIKTKYKYSNELQSLVLDNIIISFKERVSELDNQRLASAVIHRRIEELEKDHDVKVYTELEKNSYSLNLKIIFHRNAENLFECENEEIIYNESNINIFNELFNRYLGKDFRKIGNYKGKKYIQNKNLTITEFEMSVGML